MTGGDQSLKGTEPEFCVVSSSCYSARSSNFPSPAFSSDIGNPDEFMRTPGDGRIPSTVFEPSFPTNDWSMASATPRCEATSNMFPQNFDGMYSNGTEKVMTSPSIQPMDRSAGYDPDRVPANIFSSPPAGQCDWSYNSNESLFSIPNYSFRDHAILVKKSQELGLSGEFNAHSTNPFLVFDPKHNEANNFSSNLRPVIETDMKVKDKEIIKEPSKQVEMTPKQTGHSRKHVESLGEDVARAGFVTGVERNSDSSNTTGASAESKQSCNSFAFPVLLNEAEKSSSLVKPKSSKTFKAAGRNTAKSWFCFPCFRIWQRCWTCCR